MNNCLLQQIVQSGSSFVGSLDEGFDVISKWQQVKTFIPSPDYIPLRTFLRANINILARWFKIMKIISRSPYWKRNLIFIVTLDRSRSAGTQIVIRWGEVCSPDSQLSGAINIFHLWYCAFVLCKKLHCFDSLEIFLHNNNDKRLWERLWPEFKYKTTTQSRIIINRYQASLENNCAEDDIRMMVLT